MLALSDLYNKNDQSTRGLNLVYDVRTFRYLRFRFADYPVIPYLTCIHNGNGHFTNSCLLFLTRVLT